MTKLSHGWMMITIAVLMMVTIGAGLVFADDSPTVTILTNDDKVVSGVVTNVIASQNAIVVYVENGGLWWGPKPTYASPITSINDDLSWSCTFYTNPNDAHVTTFRAYLISSTTKPPNAEGVNSISTSGWAWKAMNEKKRLF
jgi:hypothetical protein